MSNSSRITNVVFAGLGGQGVIRASDILAEAAFRAGYDVKKSEIHGMSQRGGSVSSDVRFGDRVDSPMIPLSEADYVLVLHPTQIENNRHQLRPGGVHLPITMLLNGGEDLNALDEQNGPPLNQRNSNVCMLGVLSTYLEIPEEHWLAALYANLPPKVHAQNEEVFAYGRTLR